MVTGFESCNHHYYRISRSTIHFPSLFSNQESTFPSLMQVTIQGANVHTLWVNVHNDPNLGNLDRANDKGAILHFTDQL